MSQKVIVITGASSGIGAALAEVLATRGDQLVLAARRQTALEEVASRCHGRAMVVVADVTSRAKVRRLAQAAHEAHGRIDVWVNNAGQGISRLPSQLTDEDIDLMVDTNVKSVLYGMQEVLPLFKAQGSGHIINVSSMLARIPYAVIRSAYCGAKHAIQGFMDSLRSELLHEGSRVQVTMVQLPALNTPQFSWVKSRLPRKPQPVPPIYQPEVAADAIVWAAHHYRRQWYVGGSTLRAIMADKIVPGLADRYLARYGYDAQQYDGPAEQGRPNNLYEPLAGDHGAHGDFDDRASARNLLLWLSQHRRWLFLGAAVLAGWRFRAASSPE